MKIVALNGLLGYGYNEQALENAFVEPPDFVGVDGGSTDPGPCYLGSGTSFTNRMAVKRDLSLALPLALAAKAPFIVGTSGGSGSDVHVNWLRDIVLEIAKEQNLSFTLALIYTDVTKAYVMEKLRTGQVQAMGNLPLTEDSVQASCRIVSQIGVKPIIDALEHGADVVLAGRACDTAIYAAPCLLRGYDPGLAFHMAKIMECGAMCATPVAAADVMQGFMEKDYFELTPANPARRCTVAGVAAHTMYEQSNPYLIYEPDGMIDLSHSQYTQMDDRTVRVSRSRFVPAETPTLKIEGVQRAGYRAISIADIREPETIRRVDKIFAGVCAFVKENLAGKVDASAYNIRLRKFGQPLLPALAPDTPTHDLGIVIDVVGKTQEIADTVLALARARMLHFDYVGRKCTAGNLAFPYSASDIHMGDVYTFCIYHLVQVTSLSETAKAEYLSVGGER